MSKIAIIGGGIAGLTAAFYLSKEHEVVLFEKSKRLGGNAYTYHTPDGERLDIAVAVFGRAGYPNFYSLLKELGVGTINCANSYMSFHNLDSKEGLYLTPSLKGTLTQGLGLFGPDNLKSIWALFGMLKKSQELWEKDGLENLTFGQLLDRFTDFPEKSRLILICTLCLMSSMNTEEVLNTPAAFFIKKLRVHNDVISPKALFSVRCIEGGTETYVNALDSTIRKRAKIYLDTPIQKVHRYSDHVEVCTQQGREHFDEVVFACPADFALSIIGNPTQQEQHLLGMWKYKEGRVVVHRDHSSFPARDLIQAYTFLYKKDGKNFSTSVNGALWHEPQASKFCDYMSSQHPNFPIRNELIEFDTHLRTPIFDFKTTQLQKDLHLLNGENRSYFCGSFMGFGLHEDAVTSALQVARAKGIGPLGKSNLSTKSLILSKLKIFGS